MPCHAGGKKDKDCPGPGVEPSHPSASAKLGTKPLADRAPPVEPDCRGSEKADRKCSLSLAFLADRQSANDKPDLQINERVKPGHRQHAKNLTPQRRFRWWCAKTGGLAVTVKQGTQTAPEQKRDPERVKAGRRLGRPSQDGGKPGDGRKEDHDLGAITHGCGELAATRVCPGADQVKVLRANRHHQPDAHAKATEQGCKGGCAQHFCIPPPGAGR